MARVNKERLAVLLGEIERKEGGDERYAASLECVLFREGHETGFAASNMLPQYRQWVPDHVMHVLLPCTVQCALFMWRMMPRLILDSRLARPSADLVAARTQRPVAGDAQWGNHHRSARNTRQKPEGGGGIAVTLNGSSPPAGGCQMEWSSSESGAQAADGSAAAREVPSWLTVMAATHIGRFMRRRAWCR